MYSEYLYCSTGVLSVKGKDKYFCTTPVTTEHDMDEFSLWNKFFLLWGSSFQICKLVKCFRFANWSSVFHRITFLIHAWSWFDYCCWSRRILPQYTHLVQYKSYHFFVVILRPGWGGITAEPQTTSHCSTSQPSIWMIEFELYEWSVYFSLRNSKSNTPCYHVWNGDCCTAYHH